MYSHIILGVVFSARNDVSTGSFVWIVLHTYYIIVMTYHHRIADNYMRHVCGINFNLCHLHLLDPIFRDLLSGPITFFFSRVAQFLFLEQFKEFTKQNKLFFMWYFIYIFFQNISMNAIFWISAIALLSLVLYFKQFFFSTFSTFKSIQVVMHIYTACLKHIVAVAVKQNIHIDTSGCLSFILESNRFQFCWNKLSTIQKMRPQFFFIIYC